MARDKGTICFLKETSRFAKNSDCPYFASSLTSLQYGIPFYLQYLAHWPEYFIVAEAPGGELMGYSKYNTTSAFLGKQLR